MVIQNYLLSMLSPLSWQLELTRLSMVLNVLIGKEEYGTITVLYDRITHVNLKIRNRYSFTPEHYIAVQSGEKFPPFTDYNEETDYPFSIKRLSKGDLLYRNKKLNYQVISEGLSERIGMRIINIRLNKFQVVKLNYNLKNYYWQSSDFFKQIINHVVIGTLTFFGGLASGLIIGAKSCNSSKGQDNNVNSRLKNDSIIINPLPVKEAHVFVDSTIELDLKGSDSNRLK